MQIVFEGRRLAGVRPWSRLLGFHLFLCSVRRCSVYGLADQGDNVKTLIFVRLNVLFLVNTVYAQAICNSKGGTIQQSAFSLLNCPREQLKWVIVRRPQGVPTIMNRALFDTRGPNCPGGEAGVQGRSSPIGFRENVWYFLYRVRKFLQMF
jgi:hypothetical protein